MTQTLDNLRQNGTLDVIQYLERVPDKLIPRKAELIQELRQAQQAMAEPKTGGKAAPTVGGSLSADKILAQQPASIQAAYQKPPRRGPAGPGEKGADVTSPKHPPPIFL